MAFEGNDPEQLRQLARQLRAAADDLDGIHSQLGSGLRHGPWIGPDADRMRGDWDGRCVRILLGSAEALRSAATLACENADEQDRVSSGGLDGAAYGAIAAGAAGLGGAMDGTGEGGESDGPENPLEPLEQLLGIHDIIAGLAGFAKVNLDEVGGALPIVGDVFKALPWVGLATSSFGFGFDLAAGKNDDAAADFIGIGLAAGAILFPEVAIPIAIGAGAVAAFETFVPGGKEKLGKAVLSVPESFIDDFNHPFQNPVSTLESFAVNPVGATTALVAGEAKNLFNKIF